MSKLRKWMMKEEKEASSGSADAGFKLFGRTIDVGVASVDAAPCTSQEGSAVVGGAAAHLQEEEVVDDHGTSDGSNSDEAEVKVDSESPVAAGSETAQKVWESQPASEIGKDRKVPVQVQTEERPQEQQQIGSKDLPLRKPDKLVACPRCDSLDTKFCYYNNYNINQPRHFCKSCQRYWTAGGTLRNVLVGAGRRKNKYGGLQSRQVISENSTLTTVRGNYYDSAQQPLPCTSSSSVSPVTIHTSNVNAVQSTRPSISSQCPSLAVLELPGVRSASSPSPCKEGAVKSIVSSCFTVQRGVPAAQKLHASGSAFKLAGADLTLETISKVRTRSETDTTETRDDCGCSAANAFGENAPPGKVKLPQQPGASVWTHPAASLGFFNGAWPYGYNVGWSGMGLIPSPAPFCPPQAPATGSSTPLNTQLWSGPPGGVWTGIWATGVAQQGLAMSTMPFGWNMQQSGWTMPWRPVAHMAVQASAQESGDPSRKRDSAESSDEACTVREVKTPRVETAAEVAA